MGNICAQCGGPLESDKSFCKYCGAKVEVKEQQQQQQQQQQQYQPQYQQQQQQYQPQFQQQPVYGTREPVKNKVVAGLLGIFFGGFGVHKFYLGKTVQGILYILFCWTYIPAIIGFIEGIIYLTKNDEAWAEKVGYRFK